MHLLSDSHVRTKLLTSMYNRDLTRDVSQFLNTSLEVDDDPTLLYSETLLIVHNSNLDDDTKTNVERICCTGLNGPLRIPKIDDIDLKTHLDSFFTTTSASHEPSLKKETNTSVDIYILPAGSHLYTGQKREPTAGPLFLTQIKDIAESYGTVFKFALTSDVRLIKKKHAQYGLRNDETIKDTEWENFGSTEGDGPIARAIARNRTSERPRYKLITGIDGWVEHMDGSLICKEIMLCDMQKLSRVIDDRDDIRTSVSKSLVLPDRYISIPMRSRYLRNGSKGWDNILEYRAAAVPKEVDFLTLDRAPAAGVPPFQLIENDDPDGETSLVSQVAHNMARYVEGGIIRVSGDSLYRQRIDIIQNTLDYMYRHPNKGWRHKFGDWYKEMDIQGMAMYKLPRHWSDSNCHLDRAALELRSVRGPRPSGGRGGRGDPDLRAQIEALHYRRGVRRRRAIRPPGTVEPRGPHGKMSESDKAWLRCTITPFGHFVRFLIEFWKENAERIQDYEAVINSNVPQDLQNEINRFKRQAVDLEVLFNRFRHCFCANSTMITNNDVTNDEQTRYYFRYPGTPKTTDPPEFEDDSMSRKGGFRPFRYVNNTRREEHDDKICLFAWDSPDNGDPMRWVVLQHGKSQCLEGNDSPEYPLGFLRYLQLMVQLREYIHEDSNVSSNGVEAQYTVTAKYTITANILNHNIPYRQTYVLTNGKEDTLLRMGKDEFLYRVSSVPKYDVAPTGDGVYDIGTTVNGRHIPFFWRDAI